MISEEELCQQSGILLVDKPQRWTSHDVVNMVRRRFKFKKVGHCGTLDPNATGLLIIVVGKATKISERLMNGYKVYQAILVLGQATDTQDSEGKFVEKASYSHINEEDIRQCFMSFLGKSKQIPPMASAVKYKGQPLYKLARKGIEVERKLRPIEVFKIEINEITLPEVNFTVTCTKGTYVRTLCYDIGKKLQSCAYMSQLCRLQSGHFNLSNSLKVEEIKRMTLEEISPSIISLDDYLRCNKLILVNNLHELPYNKIGNVAIAIGNFDGVHIGHQKTLKKLIEFAKKAGSVPIVVTFSPHPKTVLTGEKISRINSFEQQISQLDEIGIKALVCLPFSKEFSQQKPEDFINNILLDDNLSISDICVGEKWRFGANQGGDYTFLAENLPQTNIHKVEEIFYKEEIVSSTVIRKLIAESQFAQLLPYLGRSYTISGRVVYGLQMANNQLHYPTANFDNHTYLPLQGVFAVRVFLEGRKFYGVCNIGYNPTINNEKKDYQKVEVHIINFNETIYGEYLVIEPLQKIRDELKFTSLEDLKKQILIDHKQALKIVEYYRIG